MKRRGADLPSLFAEIDSNPEAAAGFCQPAAGFCKRPEEVDLPRSTWTEVPQAVFDSWSLLRQLKYCRDRDMDGALYAPTDEEALWFKRRANSYTKEMKQHVR